MGRIQKLYKKSKLRFLDFLFKKRIFFLYNLLRNSKVLTVVMFHRLKNNSRCFHNDIWSMDQDNFIQCMKFFKTHYHIISLNDLFKFYFENKKLPRNSLLITFDDGWIEQFYIGAKILKEMNIPGVFFVTCGHLINLKDKKILLDKRELMGINELKELIKMDFSVGVHGLTHNKIDETADLYDEIIGSKTVLKQILCSDHIGIDSFSFPHSIYNQNIIKFAIEQGNYKMLFGGECCINKINRLKEKKVVCRVPIIENMFLDMDDNFSLSRFAWWIINLPHC